MLERVFRLQANGSTVRRELIAGLTTVAAMAYILTVNPMVLGGGKTGLTACVVSAWFLLALVFSPVIAPIPAAATAPILVVVGVMAGVGRAREVTPISWVLGVLFLVQLVTR